MGHSNYLEPYLVAVFPVWAIGMVVEKFDLLEKATDQLGKTARAIGGQIEQLAEETVAAVKEHPLATLAIAAGFAFALGALWKIRGSQQSRMDAILAHVPSVKGQSV